MNLKFKTQLFWASCIGCHHVDILPSFLDFYLQTHGLDPSQARFVIHSNQNTLCHRDKVFEILSDRGIIPSVLWHDEKFNIYKKHEYLQKAIEDAQVTDWILQVDVDEFLDPSASLEKLIEQCWGAGAAYVQGIMIDRLSPSGSPEPIQRESSLFEQFPIKQYLTSKVAHGMNIKVFLRRAWVELIDGGGHRVADPMLPTFHEFPDIHHFKWTGNVIEDLKKRSEDFRRQGLSWWKESEDLIRYFEQGESTDVVDSREKDASTPVQAGHQKITKALRKFRRLIQEVTQSPWPKLFRVHEFWRGEMGNLNALIDHSAQLSFKEYQKSAKKILEHMLHVLTEAKKSISGRLWIRTSLIRQSREILNVIKAIKVDKRKRGCVAHIRSVVVEPRVSKEFSVGHRVEFLVDHEEVFFESKDLSLNPSIEGILSAFIIPAQAANVVLIAEDAVDSVWFQGMHELSAHTRSWWNYKGPEPLVVPAEKTDLPPQACKKKTALFFSGGVDSFYSLRGLDRLPDALIFVSGFDLRIEHQALIERSLEHLKKLSEELGIPLIRIHTNLRNHTLFNRVNWEGTHGGAMASVAHLLQDHFQEFVVSSTVAHGESRKLGTHWKIDPLWSSSKISMKSFGQTCTRFQKIVAIQHDRFAQKFLRVCFQTKDYQQNCGVCLKCFLTRASLEAMGTWQKFENGFSQNLDFDFLLQEHESAILNFTVLRKMLADMLQASTHWSEVRKEFVARVTEDVESYHSQKYYFLTQALSLSEEEMPFHHDYHGLIQMLRNRNVYLHETELNSDNILSIAGAMKVLSHPKMRWVNSVDLADMVLFLPVDPDHNQLWEDLQKKLKQWQKKNLSVIQLPFWKFQNEGLGDIICYSEPHHTTCIEKTYRCPDLMHVLSEVDYIEHFSKASAIQVLLDPNQNREIPPVRKARELMQEKIMQT